MFLSCVDEPADNVPFVEQHGDATELISILLPFEDRPVSGGPWDGANGSSGTILLLRQLLLGSRANLLSTSEAIQPSKRGSLHSFEFRDVIMAPDRGACMITLDVSSTGVSWVDIANAANAVIVCQHRRGNHTCCISISWQRPMQYSATGVGLSRYHGALP